MNTPWLSLALTGALTTWFLIAAMSPSFPPFFAGNGGSSPQIWESVPLALG